MLILKLISYTHRVTHKTVISTLHARSVHELYNKSFQFLHNKPAELLIFCLSIKRAVRQGVSKIKKDNNSQEQNM